MFLTPWKQDWNRHRKEYSRASRYTAISCTDLDNARFWIGSKTFWDARFFDKLLLEMHEFLRSTIFLELHSFSWSCIFMIFFYQLCSSVISLHCMLKILYAAINFFYCFINGDLFKNAHGINYEYDFGK